MSRRDTQKTLQQMLDHAREAMDLAHGKTREALDHDRTFELAETRLLEIIGEAADRIPIKFQMDHPEIEWAQIISFRNRLIHGYDSIDFDIMWSIIQSDLPELIDKLEKII